MSSLALSVGNTWWQFSGWQKVAKAVKGHCQSKVLLLLTILCSFWLPCLCISLPLSASFCLSLTTSCHVLRTLYQLTEVPGWWGTNVPGLRGDSSETPEMVVTLGAEALAQLSQALQEVENACVSFSWKVWGSSMSDATSTHMTSCGSYRNCSVYYGNSLHVVLFKGQLCIFKLCDTMIWHPYTLKCLPQSS